MPRRADARTWKRLIGALLVVMALVCVAPPASAAEPGPVDDSAYTAEQKAAAEKKAGKATAERVCESIAKGPLAQFDDECVKAMSSKFTRDTLPKLGAVAACAVLTGPLVPLGAACSVWAVTHMDDIKQWFWEAYEAALKGLKEVAATVGNVAKFIANPERAFDFFVNDMKAGSVSFFETVMTDLTTVVSFKADARWWRDAYAAAAVIGLGLLAIGMMLTSYHYNRGKLDSETYSHSMTMYPLIAVVMMTMGPPVAYVITKVSNGISQGMIHWMGSDAVELIAKGGVFAALSPTIPGGTIMGLVLFALLFLVTFGVFGTLIVQTVSTYMLGASAGAAWGMTTHPGWRQKALMVPMVVLALIFARPAILFALALVTKMANALGFKGDPLDTLAEALMVIVALGMVAFAPWVLLRWFPLLPDADSVRMAAAGTGMAAAAGIAGSTATSAAMMRARSSGGGSGGGSGGSSQSAPASHSPSQSPSPQAPSAAPQGGRPAQAPVSSTPSASQMGAGAGAGAGRAGAGTAGAAAGGAGKAGMAAGGAAKTGAAAAGGAATGGALLAAQLAAQAAQTAIQKARESADAATPDVRS